MRLPKHGVSTHPGVFLKEDFLDPLGVSQTEFAKHIGVPVQRINEIVRGKRGVTAETAWLFSQAFGTTPQVWMNIQVGHDLTKNRPKRKLPLLPAMVEWRKSPEYLETLTDIDDAALAG